MACDENEWFCEINLCYGLKFNLKKDGNNDVKTCDEFVIENEVRIQIIQSKFWPINFNCCN